MVEVAPPTHRGPERTAETPTSPSHASFEASAFNLDGLRLGATIGDFGGRHKSSLCDDDPIEGGKRHVWFFAPCNHKRALPDATVVAVLATPAKEGATPAGKATAIAWFGGNWPTHAGVFPVPVRATLPEVERALGPGQRLFDFKGVLDGGEHLVVYRHGEQLYSVIQNGAAIGFVIGRMSHSPNDEEWRGLVGNALRQVHPAAR